MVAQQKTRLMIDMNDLRTFDAGLANNFLRNPAEYMPSFEEALQEVVATQDASFAKQAAMSHFKVGVEGSFGPHHVSPRGLTSTLLNRLVNVQGIVTKCSLVRPKVVKSVHYCAATTKFSSKLYRDLTSLSGAATGSAYPTKDEDGNIMQTEYGLCDYMDQQTISVQEMPECAPPGQLPRSVEVLL
jgi:DNA replication licensing factor MCM3